MTSRTASIDCSSDRRLPSRNHSGTSTHVLAWIRPLGPASRLGRWNAPKRRDRLGWRHTMTTWWASRGQQNPISVIGFSSWAAFG